MSSTWDDEKVDLLKRLWSAGFSAAMIADEIGGVSRSAVLGKIHRLGLNGSRKKVTVRNGLSKRKIRRIARSKKHCKPKKLCKSDVFEDDSDDIDDGIECVGDTGAVEAVLKLSDRDCRWPIGDPRSKDFRFCGKPRLIGLPYCEYHAAEAYQPAGASDQPHYGDMLADVMSANADAA